MKLENFLTFKILNYRRYKNSVSSPIIKISIISIVIAITVINFSLSIGFGIQNEIKNNFKYISGDYYVTDYKNEVFSTFNPIKFNEFDSSFFQLDSFVNVYKVIYTPGIIPLETNFENIIFKGIENKNLDLLQTFIQDVDLNSLGINQIIISKTLSKKLNLTINDQIKFLFFKDKNSNIPIVRKLQVAGIYNSNISEFDSRVVMGNINQSLSINKWNSGDAGALEIFLKNDNKKNIDSVFTTVPPNYDIQKSSERFPDIFNWINLFDTNIYLIIILMIIVGGINMITALLVTVLDKTNFIATLKVLGSKNNSVMKIFILNGFLLIIRGLVLGNIISLGLLLIQKQLLIFKLDPSIYYSDYIPIELDPLKIILFNLLVVLISMLMLLIPSQVITKIKPNSILKLS